MDIRGTIQSRYDKTTQANDERWKAERTVNFFNLARTSVDSVLKLFEENKDEHEDIPALLGLYKDICQKYPSDSKGEKKFPLIVLEGLDGSGKSTTGMRLAKKLNAIRVATPPKSVSSFREKFDGNYCYHAPFYYLGNYIAALEVSKLLTEHPVVMDRFWHSTTAFALAQMQEDSWIKKNMLVEKIPNVYEWPRDLLKPDIVIFLQVSEDIRSERLARRTTKTEQEKLLTSKDEFRNRVLSAFDMMVDPAIVKVNANRGFNSVLPEIHEKTKHLF